ncbi:Demethylrebeccamycin-D-glucose O-methyltransferase [Paraliobacillus sp. PM-2]|uniref:class I SAM-dependent methyltransferase n=1 Tax=Paraliobacillus sp. PM-2 TaxID=1462524 RepID=UPI00061C0346|nr:class I SAM-dependent methyltransferase [Paraliobacillus sp. PM-2]CQR46573.1 Demethylrebeccamycin-D-glucose O-methyltransferase [Paraliobacillus sp. PM-2]
MRKREVGHTFLARIGKKRLRPGGKKATEWLISQGNFSSDTNVLEVACNMGTTMIDLVKRYDCRVTGVDVDKHALAKAKKNIEKHHLEEKVTVVQANAMKLPFPDHSFDVVINEAMLTMLPNEAKEKAMKEYYRVLKKGGKLLTHDVMLTKSDEVVVDQLRQAINVRVQPLTQQDWQQRLEASFQHTSVISGPMTLLSPIGMIRDEGIIGAVRIIKNALKKENRPMFLQMFRLFRSKKDVLHFIAICSEKK